MKLLHGLLKYQFGPNYHDLGWSIALRKKIDYIWRPVELVFDYSDVILICPVFLSIFLRESHLPLCEAAVRILSGMKSNPSFGVGERVWVPGLPGPKNPKRSRSPCRKNQLAAEGDSCGAWKIRCHEAASVLEDTAIGWMVFSFNQTTYETIGFSIATFDYWIPNIEILGFPKMGVAQKAWFAMDSLILKWMFWGYPHWWKPINHY